MSSPNFQAYLHTIKEKEKNKGVCWSQFTRYKYLISASTPNENIFLAFVLQKKEWALMQAVETQFE